MKIAPHSSGLSSPKINVARLARSLAEGLEGWLAFEFHAGRGPLFCESYLTFAAGQILQRYCGGKSPDCETNHPLLQPPDRGRPYQLDFTFGPMLIPTLAIELKWASWREANKGMIVADLLRLAVLAEHLKTEALFVFGGQRKVIAKSQKALEFLSFEFDEHTLPRLVQTESLRSSAKIAVETIENTTNEKLPTQFVVRGPYGRSAASRGIDFQVFVWRISKAH